jgi:hypothetical protein
VQIPLALFLAAAPPTAWEQLKRVPKDVWINLGICVLAIVVIVKLWRGLKKFNDYAPYFAAVLAATMIFFYWVYDRSEPRFLTPLVDKLAPFFPTKGKQKEIIEEQRKARDR